jgi:alkylation response protein AidB-like acyl-CoA dehydrogenase
METVGNEIHQGQFLVANFEARWIRARGQLRLDEDILRPPGARDELSWWRPFSHLGWAALYAGLARGAFKAGRKQVRAATCPWDEKPIEREPYSRWYIAEMSARVETVSHLLYTAAVALEKAQHRIDFRVEAAKAAYHAKVFATETALAVTSHFLPVKKTSTTAERCDLDSYWRDTWSFILQDSAAYE